MRLLFKLVYVVSILLMLGFGQAFAETRALIIANDYRSLGSPQFVLQNTQFDAANIAATLRRLRIGDIRVVSNADVAILNAEIDAFARRLASDDLALVYFAGHAVQVAGRNYFVAADGQTLVEADSLLSDLAARAKVVFFVDACRDNPFQTSTTARQIAVTQRTSATRALVSIDSLELAESPAGLAQIGEVRGGQALVVFSTEPGNVASDGEPGRGSPFANALVAELPARQSLDRLVRRVAQRVAATTRGEQQPWRQGDLPLDLFIAGRPRFPVP